jgi:hypothetical protein
MESGSYEFIAGGEMLDKVLIVHVIYLDDFVGERLEECIVQGQSQDREDMRDPAILERLFAAEGKQTKAALEARTDPRNDSGCNRRTKPTRRCTDSVHQEPCPEAPW